MRNEYIRTLHQMAQENKDILALVADNGIIVYDDFRRDCADQFFNFGIAEATMVGAAAGLAACGKIPFVYTIIPFLAMRAFEQIRNDVCLQRKNVKLVGIGAGFSYSMLGPTHHGTEDIAVMRALPNISIISPSTPLEAKAATLVAAQLDGPVYIRLGNCKENDFYTEGYQFQFGKALQLKDGCDAAIIATGNIVAEVLAAGRELESEGIHVRIINMHTIKPLDCHTIMKAAEETGAIVTVEEHSILGGLGSAAAEVLMENIKQPVIFERLGIMAGFASGYGDYASMRIQNKLDKNAITAKVRQVVKAKERHHR